MRKEIEEEKTLTVASQKKSEIPITDKRLDHVYFAVKKDLQTQCVISPCFYTFKKILLSMTI